MKQLTEKNIHRFSKDYKKAARLLKEDFPRAERFWPWLLWLLALRKDVHFCAYYDGTQNAGMAYYVVRNNLLWLLYLAVDPEMQDKGYGSGIINKLKCSYPEADIVLDAEYPDPASAGYAQQLARDRFYGRLGITDTGYILKDFGVTYQILSSEESFDPGRMKKLLKYFGLGFYKPDIQKDTSAESKEARLPKDKAIK